MQVTTRGLWRSPDFRNLWIAQTVSALGSSVTTVALPLTAVLILYASPSQMGLLGAAAGLPALLFGLFAGVWVDRLRRRPILVAADLGRAVLLGSIPVVYLLGVLRMEYLYAIAFLVGTLSLFFDIAVTSFLPTVLQRTDLVDGNSKLRLSESAALVAGPSIAGGFVQLFTAPIAIVVDALSFLISAILLRRIRTQEPVHKTPHHQRNVWREIGEGLCMLFRDSLLRSMTVSSASGSLALSVQGAVLMLYLAGELEIAPAVLGVIFATQGAASLVGAVMAGEFGQRFGAGPAFVWGTLVSCVGCLFIPLATGPTTVAAPLLIAAHLLLGFGAPIYSVNQISLRQAITPDRLLGRVNASRRFIVFGVAPLGALIGGALGGLIGLRATLAVGGLGMLMAFLVAFVSPRRTFHQRDALASGTAASN